MKKLLGMLTLALCSFGLIAGVNAEEEFAKVENKTAMDSFPAQTEIDIVGSKTADVTVTINAGEWHLLDDGVPNRPKGYTWVGLEFSLESGKQFKNITIPGDDQPISNGTSFIEYFGFSLEEIEDAVDKLQNVLTKNFTVSWTDEAGQQVSQKIHLVIDLGKITLKDDYTEHHTGTDVWSPSIYEETKEEAETNHTHKITVVTEHGKVEMPTTALMGTEVTLKVTPDKGYALDKIVVDDENVKVVDNKFVMPDKDITVTVTFKQVASDTTTDKAPATFDAIVGYIALGFASVAVLGYASKKVLTK